jgi:protein TonB
MTINKDRLNYLRNRDVAFIVALVLCIIMIRLAAEIDAFTINESDVEIPPVVVENIPVTHQGKKKPPPARPAVPIPSESEDIPEDETIEPIEFDFYADNGEDGGGGAGEEGVGAPVLVPPRPIAWVIPEFPEKEKKKGVKGEVKLSIEINAAGRVVNAIVLENSTGSELCAQSAIRAAMASRFLPAKKDGKPTNYWWQMPFRFDLPN